ncbi:MAG: 4Fe-4S binding protein, partial [Actinobacteria bacterium]|nr:4Fe-4S binding protein [Actinomycetota bacterium]
PPRTRGVIALKEENCTVCMLCSRECPDWCIYIESHKDVMPPKTPGARPRTRNVLDRFAIDFALCMYCGICVEVCPFDALFWAPHFEYSTDSMDTLTHEMPVLGQWMDYVAVPPPLEIGAEDPKEAAAEAKVYEAAGVVSAPASIAAPPAATAPANVAQASAAQGAPAAEATAEPQAVSEPPAASAVSAGQPEAAADEGDHGPPEIDEETYQRELAAGKPERVARAMAKRASVLKRKKGGA